MLCKREAVSKAQECWRIGVLELRRLKFVRRRNWSEVLLSVNPVSGRLQRDLAEGLWQ
jgi:hypothetical protein